MFRRLMPLLVLLGAAGCANRKQAGAATLDGGKPSLVVLIVIDQLPSWSFETREKLMLGGIGRLLHEGAYFPRARYPYAATYTAPGHAALGTGASPSETGIICNEWWDRDEQALVESVNDAGYAMLVVDGWPGELVTSRPRASASRLRVDGIGDALHAATGGKGKAIGVSFKNRAAILPLGRKGDLAIWYDEGQRAFTTSTWYARRTPEWLVTLRRELPIGPRLVDAWEPLDPGRLAAQAAVPDDAPGEATNTAFGAVFPHLPLVLSDPSQGIKMMPLGNTVVREAALAAAHAEKLGLRGVPDLLVVSFSAYDYVGHEYGQESWEALDMLMRLDGEIDALITGLEAQVGKGRVAVVLTSDHGGPRMPEREIAAGRPSVRVDVDDVRRAVERALVGLLPATPPSPATSWIDAYREPSIYFSAPFRKLPADKREAVLDAAVAAIKGVDGIGYAFRVDKVAGDCDTRPELEAMVCRSVDLERSGEIVYGPRAGSLIRDKEGDPIAHGSPNDEDTTVPVIVWGPGVTAGRYDTIVSALQVAPTLAALLGVPPPTHAKAGALPVLSRP